METLLHREDLLHLLKELDFLGDGCWLTSGAALVLYGVKEATRDIDLICTAELADQLEQRGFPFRKDELDGTRIFQINDKVEVLEDWQTDEVIELEGLKIASLLSIRKQKEALGREKDFEDIRLIDCFLEKRKP